VGSFELDLLLDLDGAQFEMASGVIVQFGARRTAVTPERPHGITYSLVLRQKRGGEPWVQFDNAHRAAGRRTGYRQRQTAYDHWHRIPYDRGSPYDFTTVERLLEDFWREVKRALDERGIPNDL
jgi:hypothetical protein